MQCAWLDGLFSSMLRCTLSYRRLKTCGPVDDIIFSPEGVILSNDVVFMQMLCPNCGVGVTGSSLVDNLGKPCDPLRYNILLSFVFCRTEIRHVLPF